MRAEVRTPEGELLGVCDEPNDDAKRCGQLRIIEGPTVSVLASIQMDSLVPCAPQHLFGITHLRWGGHPIRLEFPATITTVVAKDLDQARHLPGFRPIL